MLTAEVIVLAAAVFVMASLYSSVGHAGASGYLAAMALAGLAPAVMKPTALTLNILVALIAATRFYRAGHFSWRIFLPFALSSIPFAFIGGALTLPGSVYQKLVGLALLFASFRLWMHASAPADAEARPVPLPAAIALGAAIGLLSGITGVGGGIFLSPILLLAGWAETRRAAGVAAAFILVNSVAGLAGHVASVRMVPDSINLWGAAAMAGGLVGTELGRRRLATVTLRRVLSAVLVVAGLKMMLA
ncbi:MAG: sulfite exporter TauE/SafE family protein [Acidobacteria bacterium]|nr:sulfite exporter TauE/SafE family protein [Acidobacteriota bacterium]